MPRRPGLGKGLGALIPEGGVTPTETPEEVVSSSPLRMVSIDSIRPNQFQPRKTFNNDSLKTLAASIAELGVLQPIIVRPVDGEPDKYELIAGERRWRAAGIAELELVPVLLQDDVNDRLSLEQAVVENLHRVDLHALEEAAAYQQLVDEFDLTHDQVAQRVGKSRAYVTNTLRLLQLGEAAQSALASSQITAGHARALLGVSDPNAQATLVAKVIRNELSVRATEEAVKAFLEPRPLPTAETVARTNEGGAPRLRPVPDASVAELEELLESYLNTRVHVDLKGRNGRIIIDFADLDDLERLYSAIAKAK
ncbi:MAG TPA: ParB/RepB/Spo0J family partition protein [Acidimicrobiales bacterium]|nr:ParB/RepB/Spo0J family partition protein [Acidimicrobiales bacterium]